MVKIEIKNIAEDDEEQFRELQVTLTEEETERLQYGDGFSLDLQDAEGFALDGAYVTSECEYDHVELHKIVEKDSQNRGSLLSRLLP